MKKTLFLVFSACIVVFSIISICTAPIINSVLTEAGSWKTKNCKLLEDEYKNIKDDKNYVNRDTALKDKKKEKNKCNREKAMYGLEYSALILDITLGFICAVLGLLHYFDVAKPFEKITGIIGLSTGVITFILTLVYICYSGYIFTKHIAISYDSGYSNYRTTLLKLDKEGAFAKKDGNQYKCLYYKNNKDNSAYAKYSDLGKRQYNYEKKRHYPEDNSKYTGCEFDDDDCLSQEYITTYSSAILGKCEYLYLSSKADGFGNKYLFDMWVTTIIFTCFICVCAIGLAIFGFLLFNSSDGSGL